jgi:putative transposase
VAGRRKCEAEDQRLSRHGHDLSGRPPGDSRIIVSGHDFSRAESDKLKKGFNPPPMAKPSRPSDPRDSKAKFRTFFITTGTADSKPILQTDRMATLFVEVLRCYMRAGKFRVHEFVVMPNHVHLLITVGADMSIEKAMQLIKGNFSFRARTDLGFLGEIWQRGFSEVRINDERSFRAHQLYIYNNPVKAGLASVAEEFSHGSLCLRKIEAQRLKPVIQATSVGTTEVVP